MEKIKKEVRISVQFLKKINKFEFPVGLKMIQTLTGFMLKWSDLTNMLTLTGYDQPEFWHERGTEEEAKH